ncbi:hypothetical protein F5J12DRAFT_850441 [Pisolithus orientalis]|uniref:uncharacterized protein n=1 Tax=Pisolithus orientalis TaxID=936130 RepID=UPI0022252172|nr:uncharacterized protein F5J12DRAFT_850441 [Pisolithus orientalis]KAI5997801.1 hypothetical protein F5J12DRAFT_850441 [Pisolithus orientalis]
MKTSPTSAFLFVALNIVRALSIVALLLVFSSSIVVLVDDIEAVNQFVNGSTNTTSFDSGNVDYIPSSTVPNQSAGVFWAVLNRLLIIAQTVILVLSEIGWPAAFFDRFFPVLGREFGVGALGVMQCLIGASVLSHYVRMFPLVTAFFLFSVGCLNILVGLMFREKVKDKRNILGWRERRKDVLPTVAPGGLTSRDREDKGTVCTSPVPSHSASSRPGMGFGRQAEKAAEMKGFLLTKPVASLPKRQGGDQNGVLPPGLVQPWVTTDSPSGSAVSMPAPLPV